MQVLNIFYFTYLEDISSLKCYDIQLESLTFYNHNGIFNFYDYNNNIEMHFIVL